MTRAVEMGLRYARANLLVGPGQQVRALYRLDPIGYPLLSTAAKWGVQRQLERLVYAVEADFSLWRVNRAADSEDYARRTTTRGTSEDWHRLVDGHREALDRLGARSSETYLAVSLSTSGGARGRSQPVRASADRICARLVAALAPGARGSLAHSQLAALAAVEDRVLRRLDGVVGLRRATTRELEWLLRRATLRGLCEPTLERFWQPDALVLESSGRDAGPVYEPLSWDVWRLPAAPVFERPDHPPSLTVETEQGTVLQAFLALGALSEEPVFPGAGAELLHAPLDALGFGVDAVVHARWLGNRDALAQVRKRIVDAEQVYRDQLDARHGPAWQAEDDRSLVREYEQVLQSGARPPMLYATISLALGAPSRDELERRIQTVRAAYGDVQLHRPRGLQERLFFDHLPRADGGRVRDYTQQVSAQQFGAMVPSATTLVGDPDGLYLGYAPTGTRLPVFYDATAPSRESRASAVLLAGTLGSGKTMAAQLIAHAALLSGSLVVDFDPKPDHGWSNLPNLSEYVTVLELTGAEDQQGRLDPMVIGLEELREELTVSYLLELLKDPPASWEHAIARAVRDSARDGDRTSRRIIGRLRELDTPAATEAADALEVVAGVGLARLGFAPDPQTGAP